MLGVIVNVITVIVGSCIGLLFKKGIPEKVSKAAMIGLGVCTLYIGISGSLCGENVLILIAAVVLGAISGTLLNIDGAINRLAEKVENKFKKEGKTNEEILAFFEDRDYRENVSPTYPIDAFHLNTGIMIEQIRKELLK